MRGWRRAHLPLRVAALFAAATLTGLLNAAVPATAAPVVAASVVAAPTIRLDPTTGPAGSGFTAFLTGFAGQCRSVGIFWNGPDGFLLKTVAGSTTAVKLTVPAGAAVGSHPVFASGSPCNANARNLFLVTPTTRPSPRPTPSTPPTPTPPPTTPPASPTPATPTASAGGSTPPGVPSVPASTPPPGTPPSATLEPVPVPGTSTSAHPGLLVLDRDNVRPGDLLTATGTGCTPGAPVRLTSESEELGATTADGTGAFVAAVRFPVVAPGRRLITASCGVVLTSYVDLVVSSSRGGQAGTLVVLIFFVLLGGTVLRWQFNANRAPRPAPQPAA